MPRMSPLDPEAGMGPRNFSPTNQNQQQKISAGQRVEGAPEKLWWPSAAAATSTFFSIEKRAELAQHGQSTARIQSRLNLFFPLNPRPLVMYTPSGNRFSNVTVLGCGGMHACLEAMRGGNGSTAANANV
jgi:hypothetical protein